MLSVVAAATENDNDSKDDNPSAVIIEDVAKTVVVHKVPPGSIWAVFLRTIPYYAEGEKVLMQK